MEVLEIGLTQVPERQERRALVRGQDVARSPLGFSPYVCQYASRPHDARDRSVVPLGGVTRCRWLELLVAFN